MAQSDSSTQDLDRYISALFAPEDDVLRAALADMERERLPPIQVSASEGKVLAMLVLLTGARRVLEIGTLGGYSAIWMARALPEGGRLLSLEIDPHHADVSRRNLARAGLAAKTEVCVGPAAPALRALAAGGEPPFDLVFIDADKPAYPEYLELALPLTRDGGVILADNTLRRALGEGAEPGIARYNEAVAAHPGLVSVILPVLRIDGIDGLLVSMKVARSAGRST